MKHKNVLTINLNDNSDKKKPATPVEHIRNIGEQIVFIVCAVIIGCVSGAVCAFFGRVLLEVGDIRSSYPEYFIPFLCIAGLGICYLYETFGRDVRRGMSLMIERGRGSRKGIRFRLIPFIIVSTWVTHLFGGSAGREGVAVQLGGTIGSFFASRVRLRNRSRIRIFTITGMAAGFGGLFQTPIAAVFFSNELICEEDFEVSALLPALVAAYSASMTSSFCGLEKFTVPLGENVNMNIDVLFVILLCVSGLLFGLMGTVFSRLLLFLKNLFSSVISDPYKRIAIVGAGISVLSLLLFRGRYSGLGTNIISDVFNDEKFYYWDFAVKTILTLLTVSVGFQGGEVTPLFAIGASLGALFALVFNLPVMLFAALGYAAVFGSATNTLFAPMFIGAEVFGFDYMPYFFAVCAIAYFCNGNKSIYNSPVVRKGSLTLDLNSGKRTIYK